MTLSDNHCLILRIQALNPCFSDFILVLHNILWLSTASDTASRTRHNFNKMILFISVLYFFNYFSRISSSINDSYTYIQLSNFYSCLFNTIITSYRCKIQKLFWRFLFCNIFVCCSQRRFHNTTGIAENNSSSRSFAHEIIIITI